MRTFPNIITSLHLLQVMPVSSASVKRANSALKFVKTDKRNKMGESRLNALLLLFLHKDIQFAGRQGGGHLCEEETM